MSLIERMSSENVKRIMAFSEVYPSMGGALLNELSKVEYWHYLTYEAVMRLNDVLNCGYSPLEISELFEKK